MKYTKLKSALIGLTLTFTGLGVTTSTAFSQNLNELTVGEMKNVTVASNPETISDFSFIDAQGKTHQISDFKGKVILLNFWATWCAPCREEMPSIDQLQAILGSDSFEVVAISHDLQGIERVTKFLNALKIQNLVAYNDKSLKSGRMNGVLGLPATLILDPENKEVARMVGPAEWDSKEAIDFLTAVIENK